MTENTIAITARVPLPKVTRSVARAMKVPPSVRLAVGAYKEAYHHVYGVRPTITYDGKWIRVKGQAQGVSLARLKAMTTQLKLRAG